MILYLHNLHVMLLTTKVVHMPFHNFINSEYCGKKFGLSDFLQQPLFSHDIDLIVVCRGWRSV